MKGFAEIVEILRAGGKVRRDSWELTWWRRAGNWQQWVAIQYRDENSFMTLPYAYMFRGDLERVPYQFTADDILATDWIVIPPLE